MERMVANNTRDYGGTNLGQFGNYLCRWGGLLEQTRCIPGYSLKVIHMINLVTNWLRYLLMFSKSLHMYS